jgi:hypothetical protein
MRRLAVLTGVCLLAWASAADARILGIDFISRSCGASSDGGSFSPLISPPVVDRDRPWTIDWIAVAAANSTAPRDAKPLGASFSTQAGNPGSPRHRSATIEYSDAYVIRRRIHRWASVATLPLFAIEYKLGSDLYSNPARETEEPTRRWAAPSACCSASTR